MKTLIFVWIFFSLQQKNLWYTKNGETSTQARKCSLNEMEGTSLLRSSHIDSVTEDARGIQSPKMPEGFSHRRCQRDSSLQSNWFLSPEMYEVVVSDTQGAVVGYSRRCCLLLKALLSATQGPGVGYSRRCSCSHSERVTEFWCRPYQWILGQELLASFIPDIKTTDFAIWQKLESEVSKVSYSLVTVLRLALCEYASHLEEEAVRLCCPSVTGQLRVNWPINRGIPKTVINVSQKYIYVYYFP